MDNDRLRVSDPRVAAVLSAAAAPAESPLPGEGAALAAFRRMHQPSRRQRIVQSLLRVKVAALAVTGGVVLASGVATAATGSLPVVSSLTGHSHTHTHSHSTGPSDHAHTGAATTRGSSDQTPSGGASNATHPAKPGGETASGDNGNGAAVSRTATTTDTTGVQKGQAVCTTATDGCRAGDQGHASGSTGAPSDITTGPRSNPPHGSAQTGESHRSTTAQPHLARPNHR